MFQPTPFASAVGCLSPAPLRPERVRVGADWTIVASLRDTGLASIAGAGGLGYASAPALTIDPPPVPWGRQATGHAVLSGGSLSYVLDDPGSQYDRLSPPDVKVSTTLVGTGADPVAAVGNATDLTGATVSAKLYIGSSQTPVSLSGSNGAVTVINAAQGQVSISVEEILTATVTPQTTFARAYPTCISVQWIDTAGKLRIADPIPLLPMAPRDYADVAVAPGSVVLIAERQGPAGVPTVTTVNNQFGTTYTIAPTDREVLVKLWNANPIVCVLPNNLPEGFIVPVRQMLAGQVTFEPAAGASRDSFSGYTKTAGRLAIMVLEVLSNTTGTNAVWALDGAGF